MLVWRYGLAGSILAGMEEMRIYEPKEAAKQLDLSPAGLRRLAGIYERVFEELPRDARRGRLWPQDAIYRLDRARTLVQNGSARSVEVALRYEDTGDDTELYPLPRKAGDANLAALLEEIRSLRQAVEHQNVLLGEQGQRLAELEAPHSAQGEQYEGQDEPGHGPEGYDTPETGEANSEPRRGWWNRIFGR